MAQQQPQRNPSGGVLARVERIARVVDWPASVVAGVGAWIVTLIVTYLTLVISGVTNQTSESHLDLTLWVLLEGLGGSVEALGSTLTTVEQYQLLDGLSYGAGIFVHMIIPAIVLIFTGYFLAVRCDRSDERVPATNLVVAGLSAALWFILLVLFSTFAIVDTGDINLLQAGVATVLFTTVFIAIGATLRSGGRVSSGYGFFAGISAFIFSFIIWFLVDDDPFGNVPFVDALSELSGWTDYFTFFNSFLEAHGVLPSETFPEVYVIIVPFLFGVVIAYGARRRDPLAGLGEGARLAIGYVLPVFLIATGYVLAWIREFDRRADGSWATADAEAANILIGLHPRSVLIAGIVYPATFAAIGGGIGALIYRAQNDLAASEQASGRSQQPAEAHPQSGQAGQGQPPQGQAPQGQPPETTGKQPAEHRQPPSTAQKPGQTGHAPPAGEEGQNDVPPQSPGEYQTRNEDYPTEESAGASEPETAPPGEQPSEGVQETDETEPFPGAGPAETARDEPEREPGESHRTGPETDRTGVGTGGESETPEPIDQGPSTEPTGQQPTTEPTDQQPTTEPTDQQPSTEPTDAPMSTGPEDEPPLGESGDDGFSSEPREPDEETGADAFGGTEEPASGTDTGTVDEDEPAEGEELSASDILGGDDEEGEDNAEEDEESDEPW